MKLIVDIGNTCAKMALMREGVLLRSVTAPAVTSEALDALCRDDRPQHAIVSSTRGDECAVEQLLKTRIPHVVRFTAETPVPIRNNYATPATLGRDRLAAAVGAATLYPGRNVMIVDFGTAVTIDLVTADGTYQGGVISPGMQSRFRALHDYTAALPLCEATEVEGLTARSTREAISWGVMNSLTFEIEGYIARLSEKNDDLLVIFSGGDAKNFEKRIKNTIFANCNLVFYGLERILDSTCK